MAKLLTRAPLSSLATEGRNGPVPTGAFRAVDSGDFSGLLSETAQTPFDPCDRLLRVCWTQFRRWRLRETAPARVPSDRAPNWGRFPFGRWAFEIKTVSKIEQRRAAEYDGVATDAIALLR